MPDLSSLSLWIQVALFVTAAIVVLLAGSRLATYADAISDRLHLAGAFVGMLMLGAITSLPEMSAVATGAVYGNAPLAVNNLLGSLATNVLFIAIADATIGGAALTSLIQDTGVLFQAILSMIATVLVLTAMVVKGGQLFGLGYWSIALTAYVLAAFWIASGYRDRSPLRFEQLAADNPVQTRSPRQPKHQAAPHTAAEKSTAALTIRVIAASAAILASGYTLARTSEGIGGQLGLSSGLSGYLLLGGATSLPEFITLISAIKLGRIDMAVGEVFGTNLFNMGLIALADILYRSGPILNKSSRFEITACLVSLLLTGVYAAGLMERRRRTFLRMGLDSILVVCFYSGGLAILHYVG